MLTSQRFLSAMLVSLTAINMAGAQPLEWSDDFQTVATYDSTSILACLYGGPPTKYTVFEAVRGDILNTRAVSGGGKMLVTNREHVTGLTGPLNSLVTRPLVLTTIGRLGLGIGCPGEPPPHTSSFPFTNEDLCIYGGFSFDPWQTKQFTDPGMVNDPFGPDGLPGIAGVDDDNDGTTDGTIGEVGIDDDGDGTTDEVNEVLQEEESPAIRPTDVNGRYGNGDGTGFLAGQDNAPGVAGVDDDGNGIIDDIGETGAEGSDDGDDTPGLMEWSMWMRLNLDDATGISLTIIPGEPGAGPLSRITEHRFFDFPFLQKEPINVQLGDEMIVGFFQPYTDYNYIFCGSGTCFGAQIWKKGEMANPAETLGPVMSTFHTNSSPLANTVAFSNGLLRDSRSSPLRNVFTRRTAWQGNTNFSNSFWIYEGDQTFADFTNGVFGYPSPSSDLNGDRDVDANDFLTFSNCFNGASNPPQPICANDDADFDEDGDVDGDDFLTFSNCFNGALTRPKMFCFPDLINPTSFAGGFRQGLGVFENPCPLGSGGGGASAMGGGGSLLAQSAIAFGPFLFDGMTPVEEFWYFYTPTCSGEATLALCDGTGQGRSVDGIFFAFFDGTGEEATVVSAAACGQPAIQTVPVVVGQTVSLLVYRGAGAESLDGFTRDVRAMMKRGPRIAIRGLCFAWESVAWVGSGVFI